MDGQIDEWKERRLERYREERTNGWIDAKCWLNGWMHGLGGGIDGYGTDEIHVSEPKYMKLFFVYFGSAMKTNNPTYARVSSRRVESLLSIRLFRTATVDAPASFSHQAPRGRHSQVFKEDSSCQRERFFGHSWSCSHWHCDMAKKATGDRSQLQTPVLASEGLWRAASLTLALSRQCRSTALNSPLPPTRP